MTIDPTMSNIELVRAVSIYYNRPIFKIHDPISCKITDRQTHARTPHTDVHTYIDSDEYSIVAFCNNATIFFQKRNYATFTRRPLVRKKHLCS